MEKDLCLRKRVYADAVSKTRVVRQKVVEAQAVLDEAEKEEKERLSAYRIARVAARSIKGPDMRVEICVVVGGVTTKFLIWNSICSFVYVALLGVFDVFLPYKHYVVTNDFF